MRDRISIEDWLHSFSGKKCAGCLAQAKTIAKAVRSGMGPRVGIKAACQAGSDRKA